MKVTIASGKGGTGKTTVATNMARVAADSGRSVAYLDCDVEAPNGHIFLKPELGPARSVGTLIPKVDEAECTYCGACSEFCQYNAIASLEKVILVFPELCHGCGGCSLVCPSEAITEVLHETGKIEVGSAGSVAFVHGLLNVGQAMSPPVIKAVKRACPPADLVILDAPPGTSCPVVESVRDCDYALLVTEPTPFGLNDLKLAVEMVRALDVPFGVVINRSDVGDGLTRSYCEQEGIAVLAEIPDDRRIAQAYSRGEMICDALPEYRSQFVDLLRKIIEKVEEKS